MNYEPLWSLRVRTPEACVEDLVDRLERAAEPEALSISAFETRSGVLWQIDALYYEKPRRRDVIRLLSPFLVDIGFDVISVAPQNWVAKTQKEFKPIRAGRFFVAQVADLQEAPPNTTSIAIEAAEAFGTGHHGTTRGCLLAIDHLAKTRRMRRVLDLGCGSGVLAIASARVWRTGVVASDLDPIATRTAQENARRNGVHPWIITICADGFHHRALVHQRFDLILANLLARPLIALAPALTRHLTPDGVLVLSGLLESQVARVRSAYLQQQMTLQDWQVSEGWATLTFAR